MKQSSVYNSTIEAVGGRVMLSAKMVRVTFSAKMVNGNKTGSGQQWFYVFPDCWQICA